MSEEKKTPHDEADEILSIIEEYKKKYSVSDADRSEASENNRENGSSGKSGGSEDENSPLMAHFQDTAELRESFSKSTLNIEAHLTGMDGLQTEQVDGAAADPATPADGEEDANDGDEPESESGADSRKESGKRRAGRKVLSFLGGCSFLVKAAVYIIIVLIASAFLSYTVITVGNDVFAFIKGDHEVTVSVPEGATRKQVAYLLASNDIIEYEWAFNLYMIYQSDGETEFIPGEHTLNSNMNYSQLITALTVEPYVRTEIRVTIPEGYTVDQIIDLLVSKGIGERDKYVEAINNYPYKHEFVNALEELGYPETRKYRLEGYLYPDTYDFYQDEEEYLVINKFLNNFQQKFWNSYQSVFAEDIEALGLTFDDIITLASMVQAEAKLAADFEGISYVFHNRLSHSDQFPKLESDATIQYFLEERHEDLTEEELNDPNPYNTRVHEGLPPGAISNPGIDAITAAIYPSAPTNENNVKIDAYFFVSNKAGKTYYAVTLSGHLANIQQVERDNAALESDESEAAS